jgi:hypothetical protein
VKCYVGGHCNPQEYDFVAVCFANSRAEAKRIMWSRSDLSDECDGEFTNIRIARKPEFDSLADKEKVEAYVVNDQSVLRQMGWRCEGDHICDSCGLSEMDGDYPVCDECGQCSECGHVDDCESREQAHD